MLKSTMSTLKNFSVAIRFALCWVNVSASRTGLTCVGRWNKYHWNTSNICFITNKQPQLIKSPIIRPASFRFATWFLIKRFSDISQVFKSKCRITLICLLDKLFRYIVIQPLLKALFSPRKPSRQSPRTTSAFGLNVCSDRPPLFWRLPPESFAAGAVAVTSGLNLLPTPRVTIGSSRYIASPQVNTNHFRRFACGIGRQTGTDIDVVVTMFCFVESSSCWKLPFEQSQLIVTNTQLELNPTTHQGNANSLQFLNILKSPNIQIDRCRSKLVNLLNCFGIINNPTNCPAHMVCFQTRSFSNNFISLVVKLSCIPAILRYRNFVYLIASVSKSLQSAIYFRTQLYRDLELTFYRYCLHSTGLLTHLSISRKAVLKDGGSTHIF